MTIEDDLRKYFRERNTPFRFAETEYSEHELFNEWLPFYTPPESVPKDGLILDVGAREGDTALFYFLLGYKNLRLVEPWDRYWGNIKHNVELLRGMGANIDLRLELFDSVRHLPNVAFAKFDCEGCEKEIDLTGLSIPAVAEVHNNLKHYNDVIQVPESRWEGIYDYNNAIGYLEWRPRQSFVKT